MKVAYLLCLAAVVSAAPGPRELTAAYTYEQYAAEFRPSMTKDHPEYALRKQTFNTRLQDFIAHNANPKNTYVKAVNKFADWSDAELKTLTKGRLHLHKPRENVFTAPPGFTPPSSVDWRTKGALSDIKNQASCGGCWAFAATEAIESSAFITNGTLKTLAVEQILRCTPNPDQCGGTGGCNGATAELAYSYAANVSGITLEALYPYKSSGGDTGACDWNANRFPPAVKVTGYQQAKANDRASVQAMVATVGPVSIGVDASSWSFYGGGVYTGCNGGNLDLDHAVQLVGYKTANDGSVEWIVRNSWGSDWGEDGFITLGDTTACVTDPTPGDGNGCKGGPSSVQVCGPCGLFYEVSFPQAQVL